MEEKVNEILDAVSEDRVKEAETAAEAEAQREAMRQNQARMHSQLDAISTKAKHLSDGLERCERKCGVN